MSSKKRFIKKLFVYTNIGNNDNTNITVFEVLNEILYYERICSISILLNTSTEDLE